MVTKSELLMHYKNGYLHYKKIEFVIRICCLNFIDFEFWHCFIFSTFGS